MIVQLTRFLLIAAGALAGLLVSNSIPWTQQYGLSETFVIIIFIILGSSIGYVVGGIVGREIESAYLLIDERLKQVGITDIALGTVGLVVGLVVATLATWPLRFVTQPTVGFIIGALVFLILGYTGLRIALVKRRDLRRAFPRLDPDREDDDEHALLPGGVPRTPKYLDTSAVIDGRFAELMRVGLLEAPVRVPRFVLAELQTLADSADDLKRARGRRGLDLLETMRGGDHPVDMFEVDYPEVPKVDEKLMRLAADGAGVVVTTDFNLTKVARVQGLPVINVNEVAAALRPALLPGDGLRIKVVREGKEPEQGVGYLEDGTMVVVQDGRAHLSAEIDVVVTSVLQTAGGRMVFARTSATQVTA
jgi:uncharacterized protein YacL